MEGVVDSGMGLVRSTVAPMGALHRSTEPTSTDSSVSRSKPFWSRGLLRGCGLRPPPLWKAAVLFEPTLFPTAAQAQSDNGEMAGTLILMLVLVCTAIYMIPTFVAFRRGHPNRWLIFAINVAFGGTGFGWLGSLVWACGAVHRSPTGNNGGESGINLFINDFAKAERNAYEPAFVETIEPADELIRLKRLLEAGVIGDTEYRDLRAGPLARLNDEC